MKRFLIFTLVCVLGFVGSTLVYAGGEKEEVVKEEAEELSGTIKMWYYPPLVTIWEEEYFPEFQKIYPNAKLEVTSIDWPDLHTKFLSTYAAGSGFPDTFCCFGTIFSGYQQSGALLDISEWMKPHMDKFTELSLETLTVDGKLYGLPYWAAGAVMYYRLDVFEDAGIDPDSIKTWKDWYEAGKKIYEHTNGKVKLTVLAPSGAVDWAMERTALLMMEQRGSGIYDKYGNPIFNSKENKEILEFLKEVMDSGITLQEVYWSPATYSALENGEIATMPQGCWMEAYIKQYDTKNAGNWRVMLLPPWEEGGNQYAECGSGDGFPICSISDNPLLTFKWLEFVFLDKEKTIEATKMTGIMPVLLEAREDPLYHEPDPYFGNQMTKELYLEVCDKGEPLSYGPNYAEGTTWVVRITTDYFNGRISVEDALKEIEEKLAKIK